MISKHILKEIITTNAEFILKYAGNIVVREGVLFPETLSKVVVLYGVRRSGKTFILYDLFKKYRDVSLYLDFEDERLLDFELKDFRVLKDAFLDLKPHLVGQRLVFLLDEVQNVEGWEKFCRRAAERENIRVFASGSSSRIMPDEIQTELRGRAWSIEVFPFSFREYLIAKHIDINDKNLVYGPPKALVKKHFFEYIKWGGFPEVSLLKSEFEMRKLLKEYLSAMYFRDLVERYDITNIPLLDRLTDRLFSSFSMKFSLTAFYRQYRGRFPFSKDLLFRYYRHFLQSMLIFEVRKFSESTYKRMRNPAKIYPVDTGICRRTTSLDQGRLLENLVFLELKRKGQEIFYFDEKIECDFIARDEDDRLSAMQVSLELNEKNREREVNGLVKACKWLATNEGIIFTWDDEDTFGAEGIDIKVIPVWKWLLVGADYSS
ncbi:MAG: ATP-binding protein [Thermodesulfobacteriota bacterium]|nr:ATP-binding protein [Thermodesulfobacteriota bacterium]